MTFSRRLLAAALAGGLSTGVHAQQVETVAIVSVTVIDTTNGRAVPGRTVTIRNGQIVSVTPGAGRPAGARVIDGAGKFLIPGLWDMHAHHQMTGEASLGVFVAAGVTGTRDMGGDLDTVLDIKRRIASGELLGPTMVTSGPILDDRPPEWPFRLTVRSADDARAAVGTLHARGVDLVKVHDRTPPDAYFAIADEARRRGLHVAGHLPRGVTIDQAIAAGQRSLEHLAGLRLFSACREAAEYSVESCAPLYSRLARAGMWQTPTLVNWRKMFTLDTPTGNATADHLAYASPGVREFLAVNREMSKLTPEGVRDMVEASRVAAVRVSDMQRAGVGILAGCDGMVAGFCLHDELALMVEGGMSPAAALQTATINPARYLGREGGLGTVEAGRRADLVLLDANPIQNIQNVSRISAVLLGGRVIERAELDTMLARARTQFSQGQRSN